MKKWIILVIAASVAASCLWWFSPEQVIRRRTLSFFDVISVDVSKPPTTRALAVYQLHPYLAPEVEISSSAHEDASGTFVRDELESAFSSICQHAVQCRFYEAQISDVAIDGKRATVSVSLQVKLEFQSLKVADGPFRAKLEWERGEKNWLLVRAEGEPAT